MMDRFLSSSLKRQWLACFVGALMLMMASALQAQDAAGTAVSVRGYVTATSPSGEVRQLARGDEVYSGDTIKTAKRSRIRMSFSDGSTSVLTSRAVFEITDYSFSGKVDGTEKASFKLVQGALEAISGLIGKKNRNAFRLDTPFATIGLRGTTYKVEILVNQAGKRFLNLSVTDGSVVYSSPGLASVPVTTGNSVSQQNGQQPQRQSGIIVTEFTITATGEDSTEAWIEQLFEAEVITEEDKQGALDALGGDDDSSGGNEDNTETTETEETTETTETTETPTTPLVQRTRNNQVPPPTSTPDPVNIEPLANDPVVNIPTDFTLPDVGSCPTGQVVSPGAPGGCAPL